jgi:hypothetical protein
MTYRPGAEQPVVQELSARKILDAAFGFITRVSPDRQQCNATVVP